MSQVDTQQIDEWQRAVVARDSAWDGRFVYAVTSTGVFCRPSCPSRRPRRDRLRFYFHAGQAVDAGYRACKRCRPDEFDPQTEPVIRVCRLIDQNAGARLRLRDLAKMVDLSESHLQRLFKSMLGISPKQYSDVIRRRGFERLLREGLAATDALYGAGYGSVRAAYDGSAKSYGMTPATYGAKGRGAIIRYAVTESILGEMLVAATESGVCSIQFGDDENELVERLRTQFSAAKIAQDRERLEPLISTVLARLEGGGPDLRLPLDIRATAFQRLVWQQLQKIPLGETRSYGEVAKSLDRPKAARAVARACASNAVALAIPCHRVIRDDGSYGGYRWGVERKRKILDHEREIGDNRER